MKKREYKIGIELTEKQWKKLEPLFPEPERSATGGQQPAPNRACLEGLLWLLRSEARYKDMPKHFPSGSTCWRRLQLWHENGVLLHTWQKILALLDKKGRLKWEEVYFQKHSADGTFSPSNRVSADQRSRVVKRSEKRKKAAINITVQK